MAMPERGYAADRLDPSLANYALTLSSGFAGGGFIEDAANTFTVEFWVKPVTEHEIDVETNTGYGGTANQKFVIFPAHGGDYTTGKAGVGVSVGTNGVSVYEHAGGYMPAILVWASPTPLTAWTHVAVVYNNKLPSLYINGTLVHTAGAASTKDYVYPCYQFPGGYYGTQTGGQMDEVRIWGVARTQAQIAASMNTEVAANSANLLSYWPMNEGTGTMLTDVTGSGRNIDLTAFGAGYSGSSWTSTGTAAIAAKAAYRYGFNGKEDDQVISEGGQDYGMRIYDKRLGRFLSVDPITDKYPMLTPYQFASNSPIMAIDLDGLEGLPATTTNNYGEKQVSYKRVMKTNNFGVPIPSTVFVTPTNATPVTKGMTDMQVYKFAFDRFVETGMHLIKSDQYIDIRLMKAEQQVNYFFTHQVPAYSSSLTGTKIAQTAIAFGLQNCDQSAVDQIKKTDDFSYRHNWGTIAVGVIPAEAALEIKNGLAAILKIQARNTKLITSGYKEGWATGDLQETITRFLGRNPEFEIAESGKVIWKSKNSTTEIVQDPLNKYFRIRNTSLLGKRTYTDLNGTVPNNTVENGKTTGNSQAQYNQLTHFNY